MEIFFKEEHFENYLQEDEVSEFDGCALASTNNEFERDPLEIDVKNIKNEEVIDCESYKNLAINDIDLLIAENQFDKKNTNYSDHGKRIDKKFECNFCKVSFLTQDDLSKHQFKDHNNYKMDNVVLNGNQKIKIIQCSSLKEDDKDKNRCKECNKKYSCPISLHIHMWSHAGEKKFKCPDCEKAFSQAVHLKTHMKVHNRERPFKCKACDKRFSTSGSLNVHNRVHTGARPYVCRVCDRSFTQKNHLNFHVRTHLKKSLGCSRCGHKFKLNQYTLASTDNEFEIDTLQIDGKTRKKEEISYDKNEVQNISEHTENNDFKVVNPLEYLKKEELIIKDEEEISYGKKEAVNINEHTGNNDFIAVNPVEYLKKEEVKNYDNYNYIGIKEVGSLIDKNHFDQRNSGDLNSTKEIDKKFVCNFCNLIFITDNDLMNHQSRVHNNYQMDKPLLNGDQKIGIIQYLDLKDDKDKNRCKECNKKYSCSISLHIHMWSHAGEKKFKCPDCDKAFSQAEHLATHVRLHNSKRSFKCKVCGNCFSSKNHLKVHTRLHADEKQVVCKICSKSFRQKNHLNFHMRSHVKKCVQNCSA